jgi:hypothetical protein
VQTFLSDETPSVVHLAILTLHHLTVNGELDFEVVFKVLSKRLRPVGDVNRVLELHLLVIEGLVTLLGDGEHVDDNSDNETGGRPDISPQVHSAVSTLIEQALASRFAPGEQRPESIIRIRLGILKSLNYSQQTLDEEGIQAATKPLLDGVESIPEAGRRYNFLKELTLQEILAADDSSISTLLFFLPEGLCSLKET